MTDEVDELRHEDGLELEDEEAPPKPRAGVTGGLPREEGEEEEEADVEASLDAILRGRLEGGATAAEEEEEQDAAPPSPPAGRRRRDHGQPTSSCAGRAAS